MITREQAISVIQTIIDSGIITVEMEEELQDIINCIKAEETLHIHAWDMPDNDYLKLHTAYNVDGPDYQKMMEKCDEIRKKYAFRSEE